MHPFILGLFIISLAIINGIFYRNKGLNDWRNLLALLFLDLTIVLFIFTVWEN